MKNLMQPYHYKAINLSVCIHQLIALGNGFQNTALNINHLEKVVRGCSTPLIILLFVHHTAQISIYYIILSCSFVISSLCSKRFN